MMTEGPKEDEPKTLRDKISEPILNAKQIFAMMMTVLYEVISNLILYGLMEDPNWLIILINVGVGIIAILIIGLLRAAYPEEVPDKTIWSAFWSMWKFLVDVFTDPSTIDNADLRMSTSEKGIQWFVREWDIAYQDKLKEHIDYYKAKLNEQIEKLEQEVQE